MKAKAWAAVVMVAFAWVLWIRGFPADWYLEEGHKTKSDCMKYRDRYMEKLLSSNYKKTILFKRLLSTGLTGDGNTMSFYCFPSDFDPRPRK